MAFVVVQHLASGRQSALPEILARSTSVPVVVIHEGQTLERNHVYVAPPGADVRVEGSVLHLEVVKAPEVPRRSVDNFLRSLARQRGRAAIGVILSGTGSDGVLGLRGLKEERGLTSVQLPATATPARHAPGRPRCGCRRLLPGPEEIGDELMHLGAHP